MEEIRYDGTQRLGFCPQNSQHMMPLRRESITGLEIIIRWPMNGIIEWDDNNETIHHHKSQSMIPQP